MRIHLRLLFAALVLGCGGSPQRLATGLEVSGTYLGFEPLAADAQNAYVVQLDASGGMSLEQVPTSGDAAKILLANQGAGSLSVDARFLYWSDGRKVGAIPLDGGTPNLLDTRPTGDAVQDLGPAGGDRLFWLVNNTDPSVARSGLLRGFPADPNVASLGIADFSGPCFDLATDADALYWTGPGGVFTRGLDDAYGSPISSFADASYGADRIAADGTNVYWTQFGATKTELRFAPRSGGPSTLLASVSVVRALAVDAKYVYWRTPRCIERAPIAGGPPKEIVGTKGDAFNLAVNADSVLWIDEGALYRLSKDALDEKTPEAGCE